jgi:serine/threonine-protein kinase
VSKSEVQQRFDEAEALLGEFLARVEAGEVSQAGGLDALLKHRPDLEPELRELWSQCGLVDQAFAADAARHAEQLARVKAILDGVRASASFSERYELQAEIGRGGMGAVLRVVDNKLERPLAMKIIVGQAAAARTGETPPVEPRQLARFLNEAKLTGQLDHPGIVPVHEVGVDAEGRAYFTMKLVKGQTLAEVFEKQSSGDPDWSTPRVLTVIERVCEAMAFAHERGVIHRDLKPANIMVGDFGEVYVMDWGLARKLGESEEIGGAAAEVDAELSAQISLTRDGAVLGTPAYMSPEQARGEIASLGPQSDVYSLGAMLYQLIAGTPPHLKKGERPSGAEVLARVVTGPPERLASPTTPPELIAICEKAMAQSAPERYGSVRELAQDLNRFVSGRTVAAFDTSAWAETKQWVRRNKALAAALAAVLLVSTGGAVAFKLKANEAEQNAQTAQANATRAEEGEKAAEASAQEAQRNATAAQLARDEATAKANDVLSLSAQKDYEDLVAAAEQLWPASSEMVPRYEEWLAKARELVAGRPADDAKGLKKRPSLAEHKAKLAELRREALPLTEEQVRADRESHPKFAAWQSKSAELLWRSRMLTLEPWPEVSAVEAELAAEKLPSHADGLNALARKLLDPKRTIFGHEVRAVLLAKRALDAASEDKRAGIRETHAWALYRCGKLDEALAEMKSALSEPGGEELTQFAKDHETAVQQWQGDEIAKRRQERDTLEKEVDALAAAVNERRMFEYTDAEKTWWDRQLRVLVQSLENFQNPDFGLMGSGLNPAFGWGVQKRYDFAKSVREQTITSAEAKRRWEEAIVAISKSEKYRDTVFPGGGPLTPQEGLLPLGTDPQSGLWEFWHVPSGDEPERDKDGNFVRQKSGAHELVEESGQGTGIVLVLIPGGTFWMGAQKTDPFGQNYDPEAHDRESPVHRVTLSPYFLSKYEMTQGQWSRFTGLNPSNYKSGLPTIGITNPVEQVDWLTCERVMRGLGLELPSEAQWEFGARGGTSSVWWTGSAKESLADKVNLADQSYVAAGGSAGQATWWPEFKDGFAVHAPVGRLAANGFGLHEVCGNVWEWCFDASYDGYRHDDATDPRVDDADASLRRYRGGSFDGAAWYARSADRFSTPPEYRNSYLGLRPSRALRLSSSPLHPPK